MVRAPPRTPPGPVQALPSSYCHHHSDTLDTLVGCLQDERQALALGFRPRRCLRWFHQPRWRNCVAHARFDEVIDQSLTVIWIAS